MTTLIIDGPLTKEEVAELAQKVRDIERRHPEGLFTLLADLGDSTVEAL